MIQATDGVADIQTPLCSRLATDLQHCMSRSAGRRFPDGSPCDGREVREGTLAGSFAREISVNLGTLGDFRKKAFSGWLTLRWQGGEREHPCGFLRKGNLSQSRYAGRLSEKEGNYSNTPKQSVESQGVAHVNFLNVESRS